MMGEAKQKALNVLKNKPSVSVMNDNDAIEPHTGGNSFSLTPVGCCIFLSTHFVCRFVRSVTLLQELFHMAGVMPWMCR
jgi:hypothetical protein